MAGARPDEQRLEDAGEDGAGRQAPGASSMQHHMGLLAEMMRGIHQLLNQGTLTPKQALGGQGGEA